MRLFVGLCCVVIGVVVLVEAASPAGMTTFVDGRLIDFSGRVTSIRLESGAKLKVRAGDLYSDFRWGRVDLGDPVQVEIEAGSDTRDPDSTAVVAVWHDQARYRTRAEGTESMALGLICAAAGVWLLLSSPWLSGLGVTLRRRCRRVLARFGGAS